MKDKAELQAQRWVKDADNCAMFAPTMMFRWFELEKFEHNIWSRLGGYRTLVCSRQVFK